MPLLTLPFAAFVVTKCPIVSELCWNKEGTMLHPVNGSVMALVSASAQFCPLGLDVGAIVEGAALGANWQISFYFILCSLNNL